MLLPSLSVLTHDGMEDPQKFSPAYSVVKTEHPLYQKAPPTPASQAPSLPSFASFQQHTNRLDDAEVDGPEIAPMAARLTCFSCTKLKPMIREVAIAVAELDENVQSYCNKAVTRVGASLMLLRMIVMKLTVSYRHLTFLVTLLTGLCNGCSNDYDSLSRTWSMLDGDLSSQHSTFLILLHQQVFRHDLIHQQPHHSSVLARGRRTTIHRSSDPDLANHQKLHTPQCSTVEPLSTSLHAMCTHPTLLMVPRIQRTHATDRLASLDGH
jgi:hypothetical protein